MAGRILVLVENESSLGPVFSIWLGYWILGEPVHWIQLGGAAPDTGAADHQRGRVPDHLERLRGVEGGIAVPLRGVDGELVRVQAQRQLVDE